MAKLQMSLKARALKYLASREHSRSELARKLARHAQEGEDVEAVLDTLTAANFLSEERFSESLVRRRSERFGNARILAELQSHNLDPEAIEAARTVLREDESGRALAVWRRKFSQPPADAAERARQMRFLQQRGFSTRAIQAALRAAEADDPLT
ncbi:MAG TPA: recombination regulator RecX [Noviherbaspirillum sp.]